MKNMSKPKYTKDYLWQKSHNDFDKMAMEISLWKRQPLDKRQKLAAHIAAKAQAGTLPVPSLNAGMKWDSNTYNRVLSRLLNCVETPEDYGFKNWQQTLHTL